MLIVKRLLIAPKTSRYRDASFAVFALYQDGDRNREKVYRRTGNFLPGGGGGKPFAQKILRSCPNVYETYSRKETRAILCKTALAVLAYEGGSILKNFFGVNTSQF